MVLSTKKNVIVLKPAGGKTWKQAKSICESICGALYFPSNLTENQEVNAIIKKSEIDNTIWIRISDNGSEGIWKDPDNKEILTFTYWDSNQPNNNNGEQHWGMMRMNGKWNDESDSFKLYFIACELK